MFEPKLGVSIPKGSMLTGGKNRVVTGTTTNNGTIGYTDDDFTKNKVKDGVTVSNRGEYSGTAFYQSTEFILGQNVIYLEPKIKVTQEFLLYVVTLVNKLPYGGYDNYPTKGGIVDDILELPVLNQTDTTPYWDYMAYFIHNIQQQYADQLEEKSEYELDLMCQILGVTREDIAQRVEYQQPQYTNTFTVGELFEPKLGVNVSKDLILTEGKNRLVSGTTTNNGTIGYIEEDIKGHTYKEGVTVSNRGEYSGSAFYQPTEFILGPNVIYLEPKIRVTQEFLLYIVALVNKLPYGGYDNYPTKSGIVEDVLELPVLAPNSKQIDWGEIRNVSILGGINYLVTRMEVSNRDLAIIRQLIH